MSLIPWPWGKTEVRPLESTFGNFQTEMNRLLDAFWRGDLLAPKAGNGGSLMLAPDLDVCESDEAVDVSVELPGIEQKDVEITLSDGNLHLKGEKKEEMERKEKDYYRRERRYGAFHRMIALPTAVDEAKVAATFKNGILSVHLPKTKEVKEKTKHIPIKTA